MGKRQQSKRRRSEADQLAYEWNRRLKAEGLGVLRPGDDRRKAAAKRSAAGKRQRRR